MIRKMKGYDPKEKRHRWKDNIRIDVKGIRFACLDLFYRIEYRRHGKLFSTL
jgi:hypothetical protein